MNFLERFWVGCGNCHGNADQCPLNDTVRHAAAKAGPDATGARMVVHAMVVFLLPLAVAVSGAYTAGTFFAKDTYASLGVWQTAGTLVGFAAGTLLAKVVLLAIKRRQTRPHGGVS